MEVAIRLAPNTRVMGWEKGSAAAGVGAGKAAIPTIAAIAAIFVLQRRRTTGTIADPTTNLAPSKEGSLIPRRMEILMNRLSRITRLVAVLVGGLLIGIAAAPANAGTFEWTDAKDDATQFLQPQTEGMFENEPALDVTKVTMASDDKALVWTAHVAKASPTPSMNSGYFFRFQWTYEGAGFALRVGDFGGSQSMQLRSTGDLVGFDLPCNECSFKLDEAANAIAVTVPIASLIEGTAAADDPLTCPGCRTGEDPLPPLAKGAEFTGLQVIAQRYYVRVTPTADSAPAPEGSAFVL
jgi:hypothetical protein